MLNNDVIYYISTFLTEKELFLYSIVSNEWSKLFFKPKKQYLSKKIKLMQITHCCNNICPCFLANYYTIPQYNLDKLVCDYLNKKENWIKDYMK